MSKYISVDKLKEVYSTAFKFVKDNHFIKIYPSKKHSKLLYGLVNTYWEITKR